MSRLQRILNYLQDHHDRFVQLGSDIWSHSEIKFEEYFAAEVLSKVLAQGGFDVERGIAGLETAFRAT